MIAGLATPSSGSIELFGSSDLVKERAKIGTVIESPALFPNMTARENLITQCRIANVKDLRVVDETLELVGLSNTGKKKAKNFSLGMRQRLAIAIALIGDPEFLILDEHTAALDPKTADIIMELTNKVVQEKHLTAMMVTHNLRYAVEYGSRLIMMDKGHIVLDKAGEEKVNTKVDDILDIFTKISIECGN